MLRKIILLWGILISCSLSWSCKNEEKLAETNKQHVLSSESFDWLLGEWRRTNEQEGKQTFENWKKARDTEYHGFGFTLQNSDTVWKENIILIKHDTIWNFEVTGHGEDQPTIFRIINIGRESFDSENQENEFPQVISYSRDKNNLKAVISGNGMVIPFDFAPVEEK